MEEDKILEERKKRFISLLKKDKYFAGLSALSAFSLLSAILVSLGTFPLIGIFTSFAWTLLFILNSRVLKKLHCNMKVQPLPRRRPRRAMA